MNATVSRSATVGVIQKTVACEMSSGVTIHILGGGFKYFFFSPLFGEDSHFD